VVKLLFPLRNLCHFLPPLLCWCCTAVTLLLCWCCCCATLVLLLCCCCARYGIPPSVLGEALVSDPEVKAFAVLIASLGDEAQRTMAGLPAGRGFTCMDSRELPQVCTN
jgi:hypothetical protein